MLEAEGYKIEAYADGHATRNAAPPDLAIVDINMLRLGGVDYARRLRRKHTPIILLTSDKDEIDAAATRKMGARICDGEHNVVACVRKVLRRVEPQQAEAKSVPQILKRGNLTLDLERHSCIWKGRKLSLTATEFQILHVLIQHPGHVKDRKALKAAAYDDASVDDRTIDRHIHRLRGKFKEMDEAFDAIETLYGLGYRFIVTKEQQ